MRQPACDCYFDAIGATNRLFLSGYLQGFPDRCSHLIGRQVAASARIDCDCARAGEVQTLINWARIERHRQAHSRLKHVLDRLDRALTHARGIDSAAVPAPIAAILRETDFFRDGYGVRPVETAKAGLAAGRYDVALKQLESLTLQSDTALELEVRCLLEIGRYDRVVMICAAHVGAKRWLRDYALIAYLRAGVPEMARQLLPSLEDCHPLPRLRAILELLRHGMVAEALALQRDLSAAALRRNEAPTLLIAAALFREAGIAVPDLFGAARAALDTSRHFPAVRLAAAAFRVAIDPRREDAARKQFEASAHEFRRLIDTIAAAHPRAPHSRKRQRGRGDAPRRPAEESRRPDSPRSAHCPG